MTLTEQARRRVELASTTGAKPHHWIANAAAEAALLADALPDACADGALLHGLPLVRGRPRSDWALDLVVTRAPVCDG